MRTRGAGVGQAINMSCHDLNRMVSTPSTQSEVFAVQVKVINGRGLDVFGHACDLRLLRLAGT